MFIDKMLPELEALYKVCRRLTYRVGQCHAYRLGRRQGRFESFAPPVLRPVFRRAGGAPAFA